ncbi:MAG: mechanosensitive ion channel family protein, partial [Nitrospinota bacterium]
MDMNIQKLVIPAVAALISLSLLFLVRGITFRVLHRWAGKTETDIDDIIIKAFKTPSFYWCIAIGLYIGVAVTDIQERYIIYISKTIHVIVIFSITVAAANLSEKIFSSFLQRSHLPIPA